MKQPPEDPSPELERVVEAISEGEPVEWEKASASRDMDPGTLKALRLIDTVSRLHRSGGAPAREQAAGAESRAERTWGGLRIRGPLGAGEYGEVYRAFDPGLRKEVALKLWSATAQARTIEWLLEEARALARVRHPNVLLVLGADVHDGQVGMWTELLEGATLEQLLGEIGPGHWREMAVYAIDLCRALSAVHAVGLVHRDVKAANVMRERGGRIVLMDFGSADTYDAAEAAGEAPEAGPSPGGNEGTPLAMAPEVLRGERACPASDLYSLGALIFRLVAGRYPVHATSLDELREAHTSGPLPSLRSVRPDVPSEFSDVVARALERNPAARFANAVEMERALASALTSGWLSSPETAIAAQPPVPAVETPRTGHKQRVITWATAAVVLAAILVGEWWARRPVPANPTGPLQFTLQLPPREHLKQFANVVVSPDGSQIAFASIDSTGVSALWIRRFDSLTSLRIPGTEGAWYPFWSPDSRQVAFFANGELKRVGIEGEGVHVICRAELGRGGTWNREGTILFAPSLDGGLVRVPAGGGTPVPATTLEEGGSEVSHRWPCFLPDGDHFLYVTTPETRGTFALYVGSLRSDRRAYVGQVESGALYTSGMLVYMANQALEARPFDLRTLRWSGEPRPVSAVPGYGGSVAEPHTSASQNGTLVYAFRSAAQSRLEWIDVATGAERTLSTGPYFDPRLSPDGRRIAAERTEGSGRSSIWMIDAVTGGAERWTDAPGLNRKPIWSPAGDTILFSSNRSGRYQLLVRGTDGSVTERSVLAPADGLLMWPNDWGPGGITFDRYEPGTSYNIYRLAAGVAVPLVVTPSREGRSAMSPDGRWLAFESNRAGTTRVQLLDLRSGQQYELPTDGGIRPTWARATGRLFHCTAANEFFEVTPLPGRPPSAWPSRRLFRTGVLEGYDVDAHGRRLLCCVKTDIGHQEEVAVLVNLRAAVAKGL